ncbi:MAG TPA: TCAD7 domain-containing protein [Bryobacteraceae bacterium]|nr:TCAD7 domain-containing protein [Bryobacteraceae bacterium]
MLANGEIGDDAFHWVEEDLDRFAARLVVGQTVKYLERNVRTGLIRMNGLDPSAWHQIIAGDVKLPKDRSARILLFVHGTFSSTIGSFGHLCGTPWGQAFLAADPIENASHLLGELEALGCSVPPQIDAVAYSRGGLVLRSLVEHVLPASRFRGRIRKAVFVACTNAGTKLADAENWHTFLDLYTNIAVGAFRLLSWLPQVQAPALILTGLVQSVGAFVKHLATNATSDVPGLAMRPGGDFVRILNETQANQPRPADTLYYAVTSEFRPALIGGDHKPKELPLRLVLTLADRLVDRVMNAANDLVVDTPSMSAIDAHVGGFIKDTVAFGTTPMVYHTTYFTRPELVNACTRWLELPPPALQEQQPSAGLVWVKRTGPVLRSARKLQTATLQLPAPLPGRRSAAVAAPAVVDTDIVVASGTSNTGEVLDLVREVNPSYLVVTRPYEGGTLHYAFRAEELAECASWPGARDVVLTTALNLHETDSSQTQPLGGVLTAQQPTAVSLTARRGVVLSDGHPVGVVPEPEATPGQSDVVELAKMAANPSSTDIVALRRTMPTFARPPVAVAVPSTVASAPVTCHFLAEIDSQVQVNHMATVEVSISRDLIAPLAGRTAATSSGQVDPARKIIVQVIPKVNFAMAGDTDRAEIDVPAPSEPVALYFDVKATNVGNGEVWAVVRQYQTAIARLVLRPSVVDRRQMGVARSRAESHATEARPLTEPPVGTKSQRDSNLTRSS